MYRIPIVSLRLVRDKTIPYHTNRVTHSEDAFELVKGIIADKDREVMLTVCLDCKNKVVCITESFIGKTESISLGLKEIFRLALTCNASSIILAHNHPSGDPAPSNDDNSFTTKVKEAGALIGINVLDHLIIGDGKFYSFSDMGRI